MAEKKYQRRSLFRKFVIYPLFQFQLIAFINAVMVIGFSVISFQVYRSFEQLRTMGNKANYPSDHILFRFMDQQLDEYIMPHMLVGFAVVLIITNLAALWISQRLAGPIVKLNNYFDEVAEKKEILPLTFRNNDFFKELPPKIVNSLKTMKDSD
jgi:hypothetical protein